MVIQLGFENRVLGRVNLVDPVPQWDCVVDYIGPVARGSGGRGALRTPLVANVCEDREVAWMA